MQSKLIKVSPKSFQEIDLLATATHWTKGQVVDWLIGLAKESKNYKVITIPTVQPESSATPVSIVTIQET